MRVAVLGAGSWGTALARMIEAGGHEVRLWGRNAAAVDEIRRTRENRRYLSGHPLGAGVTPMEDARRAVDACDLVLFALPSPTIRALAQTVATGLSASAVLVCASKGLEDTTLFTLDRVLEDVCPKARVVLLSGPTFAEEIARGLPAAAVAASKDLTAAAVVQRVLASERFRVYTSEDVTGVALGGALKNVIAIAAGCSDGLGFGHNARAALITRGLGEIARLATSMGANPMTLAGLAGLGDLILTCTGELSRNRRVGLALAQGEPLAAITTRLGQVAEGVETARLASALAHAQGIDMPITAQVAAVLAGERSAREAVADLLAREPGAERR